MARIVKLLSAGHTDRSMLRNRAPVLFMRAGAHFAMQRHFGQTLAGR